MKITYNWGNVYVDPDLGELQIKILKHMLSCKAGFETVSHISREINALQPAVFRSVANMIKTGILTKKGTEFLKGKKKEISLTNKGMAAAVLAGIKSEKLAEYLGQKLEYKDEYGKELYKLFDIIKQLLHNWPPTRQDFILKAAIEYMITQEWFDEKKDIMNQRQRIGLFIHLIPYMLTNPKEVKEIVELIDKFGIDRKVFGEELLEKVNSTLEAVNEYIAFTKIPYVVSSDKVSYPCTKPIIKNIETLVHGSGVISEKAKSKVREE